MPKSHIILGSASARRQQILEELELLITTITVETDETHDSSDPVGTVIHNALVKHAACRELRDDLPLITADTVVYADSKTLGKPQSESEAIKFLVSYSNRVQSVFSGVSLSLPGGPVQTRCCASSVRFKTIDQPLAKQYLKTAMTLDRAGAYDINTHGEMLISSYSGSYSNIMGLPRGIVADWLSANGCSVTKPQPRQYPIPKEVLR